MGIDPLPAGLVEALRTEGAYPSDPSASNGISEIQTHISHLFLTGERVYKVRKAVNLSFLSFASRDERNADCLSEISLNRRLAPDVYFGVAPIDRTSDGGWCVGAVAEKLREHEGELPAPEHCVVMRRLDEKRDGTHLLQDGELGPEHIDAVARCMAAFHAHHSLGTPAPYSQRAWFERVEKPITDTLEIARNSRIPELPEAELSLLEKELRDLRERGQSHFEQRRTKGRVVDGHGDLQLSHVWFEKGSLRPLIIDCTEFDEELRRLDTAAELAFFAMDLGYRGQSELSERFLRKYAEETDDFALYGVIDYYIVHRALVRASVAGIAAGEREIDSEQRRAAAQSAAAHLGYAINHMNRAKVPGLVLICGQVGTGKSTVAEQAADLIGGAVVSSDQTRKHLAGVRPEENASAAPGDGIYTEEWSRRTYDGLLERAEYVIDSGRVAVLDATYSNAAERGRARALAERKNVPAVLLEVRCAERTVFDRLVERERAGHSVSDAGPALMGESASRFEPPREWEPAQHVIVRTDDPSWREPLRRDLQATVPGACRP